MIKIEVSKEHQLVNLEGGLAEVMAEITIGLKLVRRAFENKGEAEFFDTAFMAVPMILKDDKFIDKFKEKVKEEIKEQE